MSKLEEEKEENFGNKTQHVSRVTKAFSIPVGVVEAIEDFKNKRGLTMSQAAEALLRVGLLASKE